MNSGVGCHSILQGIFLTQELNLGLLHCRQIHYHLRHQGGPHSGKCSKHLESQEIVPFRHKMPIKGFFFFFFVQKSVSIKMMLDKIRILRVNNFIFYKVLFFFLIYLVRVYDCAWWVRKDIILSCFTIPLKTYYKQD